MPIFFLKKYRKKIVNQFIQNIPYPVCVTDIEGKIFSANEPYYLLAKEFFKKECYDLESFFIQDVVLFETVQKMLSELKSCSKVTNILPYNSFLSKSAQKIFNGYAENDRSCLKIRLSLSKINLLSRSFSLCTMTPHLSERASLLDPKITIKNSSDFLNNESDPTLKAFCEKLPFPIAYVNKYGRIKECNASFQYVFKNSLKNNIEIEDSNKKNLKSLLSLEVYEQFLEVIEQIPHIKEGIIDLSLSEERDQKLYLYSLKDIPILDSEEDPLFLLIVTEEKVRKLLSEQMVETQKMQAVGQLAGGIAHDFNNVLTAIIMSTDLLLSNYRRSDPSFPDIISIKQNAERAAALVRQLLAFSRRQTLKPQPFDLTDVLSDWRLMLSRYVGPEIRLKIEHGQDLWRVLADIDEFSRVIINLAGNAADAMPNGGEIIIRTGNFSIQHSNHLFYRGLTRGDYVQLDLSDTGSGIAPDILDKIFEPFFTTKDIGKGTGLGLSMVYGIIKQTGGHIYCNSIVGKGSTFSIFLPRYQDENIDQGPMTTDADNSRSDDVVKLVDLSGSAKILLVEDEEVVRRGGARILRSRGYQVLEATSGMEALKILKENNWQVDLIISDVVMPEMDGPTLLQNVRVVCPTMKFIFVSGYAEEAFSKNLPESTTFSFLSKPFSLKELASMVKTELQKVCVS